MERVKQIGLAKYIDQQIHPESIDDSKEESRIRELFPTMSMSSGRIDGEISAAEGGRAGSRA